MVAVTDNGARGAVVRRHALDSDIEVSPSLDAHGDVIFTTNAGSVYANSASGHLLWHERVGAESYASSSVTPGGLLYFGNNGGELHVRRAANGHRVTDHAGTQTGAIVGIGASGHGPFRVQATGPTDSYPTLTGSGFLITGDQSGTVDTIGWGSRSTPGSQVTDL